MTTRTLFTAFAIAQTRTLEAPRAPTRISAAITDDMTLLNALRNSATDCDQIMQRRIGLLLVS